MLGEPIPSVARLLSISQGALISLMCIGS